MALSTGQLIPSHPNISLTSFWLDSPTKIGPDFSYCALPPFSLYPTRIASLTNLTTTDCGTCISICSLTPPFEFFECGHFMLVDTNSAATPTVEISAKTFSQHFNTTAQLWGLQDTVFEVAMADFGFCQEVWTGEKLEGVEPKG
ncbi:MAG: hypothetical protein Q9195_009654, partial [Heterodermia aff. obscurata]